MMSEWVGQGGLPGLEHEETFSRLQLRQQKAFLELWRVGALGVARG